MKSRLIISLAIVWACAALVSARPFDPAAAQEPPTKPPIELPTKPPVEPTDEPPTKPPAELQTKTAPTALPTKEPATSTPIPAELPTKTPIGPLPTKAPLPTATLSATSIAPEGNGTPSRSPGSPGPGSGIGPHEAGGARAAQAHSTANAPAAPVLIGVVFDDGNHNGVRDVDERGLPGIAVIVEAQGQPQVLITDASGAYATRADPTASVRVVPLAGWTTTCVESLALDRAHDFPLMQREAVSIAPAMTSSVINFTSLALGFIGLGAIVWLGLLQHQRARVHSFNAWARADLRLRSEAERLARRDRLVIDDAWIVALLNQAGLDAAGEPWGIDQVERLILEPIPAIVGLGRNFQRLVFTPASEQSVRRLVQQQALSNVIGDSLRGVRVYTVDALNGDLFVTDDLAAAFTHLCGKLQLPALPPASLPRAERWSVYVVPGQRGKVAR